ncbi:alpha-L-arabinofuranosidase II, partial [Dendryphion nanum]
YNDSILTITEKSCADPYVICDKGVYYMTFTADGNRIEIWSSDSLFDLEHRATKHVIWRPPPDTEYTSDIWAPELHILHGRWYVYFAADHPLFGNMSHRMFVLRGPESTASPLKAEDWDFAGPLAGMPEGQWAIDGTVITLHGAMLFVYSGWPLGQSLSASIQELFIIEMADPVTCVGKPTRISTPEYQWEFSGKSGINEGPQFLASPDGRWCGIAYSCAGSWTSEYKMNVLEYKGGDPLAGNSWEKWRQPLLRASSDGEAPYGPGHGNFVLVDAPGGPEVWGVFHATDGRTGWAGRRARVMRVGWGDGGPYMGDGECGRCTGDVDHFLYGCKGDGCECGG